MLKSSFGSGRPSHDRNTAKFEEAGKNFDPRLSRRKQYGDQNQKGEHDDYFERHDRLERIENFAAEDQRDKHE